MKQLSANPSVDSTTKGWELLQNMVKVSLPSAEVYEFLIAFVQREATPAEPEKKEGEAPKRSGWKAAFFDVVRKQREEQMNELNNEDANSFNLSSVVQMAVQ